MDKYSDESSQGARHPPHLSDALIHLTSQFDSHVCVLHLANVSSLALYNSCTRRDESVIPRSLLICWYCTSRMLLGLPLGQL